MVLSLAAVLKTERASPVSKLRANSNLVVPVVKFKPLMTLLRFLRKSNHSSQVPVLKYATVSSYCGELPSVGVVRNLYLCDSPGTALSLLCLAKGIGKPGTLEKAQLTNLTQNLDFWVLR